jgi:hypothetical protein
MRREAEFHTKQNEIAFKAAAELSMKFSGVAKECAMRASHSVHKTSWENLAIYAMLSTRIFTCYEAIVKGEYNESHLDAVKEFVFENEHALRFVFDSYEFLKVFLEFIVYATTGEHRAVLI